MLLLYAACFPTLARPPSKHLPSPACPQATFAATCAVLCERHCPKLLDITGEMGDSIALDLGCATGGAAFELAERCVKGQAGRGRSGMAHRHGPLLARIWVSPGKLVWRGLLEALWCSWHTVWGQWAWLDAGWSQLLACAA